MKLENKLVMINTLKIAGQPGEIWKTLGIDTQENWELWNVTDTPRPPPPPTFYITESRDSKQESLWTKTKL